MTESIQTPAELTDPSVKWRNLALLALAELLAMALWFSASALIPQLGAEWQLGDGARAWLTMSVQLGFVVGALLSALLTLPDRMAPHRLIALCCLAAALANGAILLFDQSPAWAILCRFLTGAALAGVYPPGMKLMASWCRSDRGLGIGILIGALTLGSAVPHLLNTLPLFGTGGMPPWRSVILATSAMALAAALIVGFRVSEGPYRSPSAPFNLQAMTRALAHRPTRLANFGYLGHMWELYAMWAWVPLLLLDSYQAAGWSAQGARFAAFATIAIGAPGCVAAGLLADRLGRTRITFWSMVASGSCALLAGLLFAHPALLTALCLLWGLTVVADSGQFSAAISELCDPRYIGTALTVQTCLGFLLTLVSIRLIPLLSGFFGGEFVFAILALGPALGAWSMARLRRLPEAVAMASGKR